MRTLIYAALALLFLYKALHEFSSDPLWGLIYVLVGAEYALEGGSGEGRHHGG